MKYGSRVLGVGSAFPERVMSNVEFESFLDTSDEWIRTRTGISTRRIANPKNGETTLTMSRRAAESALKHAGIKAEDLDMIVVGTVTPDTLMPTTANQIQALIGAKNAFSFDLQAACSGWVYGLSIADQYIKTGAVKNALVIGVETLSSIMDWQDRGTCVLFGDAAGAVILQRTEAEDHRIVATKLYSDGTYGELLCLPHGFNRVPTWSPDFKIGMAKIKMKGGEVFKHAVRNMVDASNTIMAENNVTPKDVDFFIFHQANMRIIEMCMKTLNVNPSQTWNNVDKYGNTSAATLPICLEEAWKAGAVKPGDLILMATFGGGLTWASTLIRL
jgi:3-oxoacyl-[acyl-carrier-protein] synthase-3